MMPVNASGQGADISPDVITEGLTRIDRDMAGLAARLFPWGSDGVKARPVSMERDARESVEPRSGAWRNYDLAIG